MKRKVYMLTVVEAVGPMIKVPMGLNMGWWSLAGEHLECYILARVNNVPHRKIKGVWLHSQGFLL